MSSHEATSCSTETDVLADAEPEVAVIVVDPDPTAVTRPADTVATAISELAHVTVALAIVAPFWSLTVADSCCCSPSEEKLRVVADSEIEVATGVGGVGVVVGVVGAVPPSPQADSRSTAVIRI